MGICKCRKRTELFCFVHKKAVCESCICTDHQVCVVKSYFDWLSEPEYESPVCGVCKGELSADNMVRFLCLDMFHPECVDVYASSLPVNTALAGYTCPSCEKPILPAPSNTSVLAQQVKKSFAHSPWAERVLASSPEPNGNPDLPSDQPKLDEKNVSNITEPSSNPLLSPSSHSSSVDSYPATIPPETHTTEAPTNTPHPLDPLSYHPASLSTSNHNIYPPSTTINIDQPALTSSATYGMTSHRKAQKPITPSTPAPYLQDDEDEDKYKKKGFMQLFAALGLVSTQSGTDSKRGVHLDPKRVTLMFAGAATLLIIFFLYFVVFTDPDPAITTEVE